MNWFGICVFVGVAIFSVVQLVFLIKDIKNNRRNKTAVADKKGDDLKGSKE